MPEVILRDRSGRPVVAVSDDTLSLDWFGRPMTGATPTRRARQAGLIAANAALLVFTVPADADRSYLVWAHLNITITGTFNFGISVTYTDETNTSRIQNLNFQQFSTGVVSIGAANASGAVPWPGLPATIRCKAGTTVTFGTGAGGVFTSVTYNVEVAAQEIAGL